MPAVQAAGIADALLHLYQAKAESLHQRAGELIRAEVSPEALRGARDDLGAVDRAIDQLGWDRRGPDRPVEVTAERAVLREGVVAAIDEAGDRLSAHCTALLRGEGSAAAIDAGIEDLRGLLKLLRETESA
ncbi:MAG: hypothetical protein ACRDLY_12780 [Thermoleophilaceae bacterium]